MGSSWWRDSEEPGGGARKGMGYGWGGGVVGRLKVVKEESHWGWQGLRGRGFD